MAVLLSACSGQDAVVPVDPARAVPKEQASRLLSGAGVRSNAGKDVNCSAYGGGKVGQHQADLIAVETEAGTVGCTQAFTVVAEYTKNIGRSKGTDRELEVQGWRCMTDTSAKGAGSILCTDNKLLFYTDVTNGSSVANPQNEGTGHGGAKVDNPDLRFPNTTQTVQLTGYDSKVQMVGFKLVQWVAGGANNGHFGEVQGDTATHRLPLADSPTVRSATGVCPTERPAVDGNGHGTAPCSKERLVNALLQGGKFTAQIKIDGEDRIVHVTEIYTP
ncbi:hypothetical protein AOZ06_28850 [Kibdelosporangium phytohabitans]|uniref:Uncharacterized protein n=2 Tax=Kibdelosporangium phytohabitans TaxID=860235 RepID=A0A0N9I6X1_9PSEU|nr:hypothetical protein AOZ06_28850 [Kibdelosporangium phytohabitans]